jgi:hypothetical protein
MYLHQSLGKHQVNTLPLKIWSMHWRKDYVPGLWQGKYNMHLEELVDQKVEGIVKESERKRPD